MPLPPTLELESPRRRAASVAHASAWAVAARLASLAGIFVAAPFAYQALGPIEFGAWASATAFLYLAVFLDLGLGNGTMNLVATAHARNQPDIALAYLREGTIALSQIGLVFAGITLVFAWIVPWYRLLGLGEEYAESARATALIVGIGMAISAPLGLAGKVQLGRSQGKRTYRWQAAGHLVSLGLVVFASTQHLGLAAITAAAILGPLLASLANTLLLWREMAGQARPVGCDASALRSRIRRDGLTFFMLQVAAALALTVDVPMIAWIQGAEAATPYALAQRVYSVIPIGLGLVLAPLWPIYRQAFATGDHNWARRTLRTTLRVGAIFAIAMATVLTLSFSQVLTAWVGPAPQPHVLLAYGLATWCVLESFGVSMSTYLNAAGIMRIQLVTASLFAVGCLSLKIFALIQYDAWLLPWITALVYLVTTLLPTFGARRRLMQLTATKTY